MSQTAENLTIVIPAYNEEKSIGTVLKDICDSSSGFVAEVIVVDDGSSDQTAEIAEGAGVRVIRHSRNRGYGSALKTGVRAAHTTYVLTMDSDGQHRTEDVRKLWDARAACDMVVGQRTELIHSSLWRMPGKWLLTLMANYIARQRIPDLNSGLRLMRREVILRYIHLCPSGFSFSTTITLALFTRGYDIKYVPIRVQKRIGKSTVSLSTGLSTIILILRISALFEPLRIFLPISFITAGTGILWGVPYLLSGRGISIGALLALVTALMVFILGLACDQISQLRLERYE
jgi:glycosyltransferase involved in cell wall biosynthesis